MKNHYDGMRVLVTGGLGFIGLNLVKTLFALGAQITILNRTASPQVMRWLDEISQGRKYELFTGEAPLFLEQFANIEVIFNLAGKSGASGSLRAAHSDMQANIEFHLSLLETLRKLKVKPRVVFTSSRLVYGHIWKGIAHEEHPTNPTSLYGLHKLTVEHYLRLYALHYDVPYTVLRLTNPYGPYQSPEKKGYGIINQFIMAAVRGETISIYGDGKQLRDYIYIQDLVDVLILAAIAPGAFNQIINAGYGKSISLVDIVHMTVDIVGNGKIQHIPWPNLDQKVETGDFICDISKVSQLLNWRPQVDWATGIKMSAENYEKSLI